MSWAIRLVGVPDGGYDCRVTNPWEGGYLAVIDVNANAGLGEAVFSESSAEAIRYETFQDARDAWYEQSSVLPVRSVGGREFENRPIAVLSISIDEI